MGVWFLPPSDKSISGTLSAGGVRDLKATVPGGPAQEWKRAFFAEFKADKGSCGKCCFIQFLKHRYELGFNFSGKSWNMILLPMYPLTDNHGRTNEPDTWVLDNMHAADSPCYNYRGLSSWTNERLTVYDAPGHDLDSLKEVTQYDTDEAKAAYRGLELVNNKPLYFIQLRITFNTFLVCNKEPIGEVTWEIRNTHYYTGGTDVSDLKIWGAITAPATYDPAQAALLEKWGF